jgi:lipoprotein signal peptidase
MNDFPRIKESALYRAAYFIVSLAVLLLDQWTKGIITRTFDVHQSTTVVEGLFDLTYVRNSGAAFGLFASVDSSIKAVILNSVAVLVFIVVSAYALRSSHKSVRLQVGFALILGGAIGNLMDRVRFSYPGRPSARLACSMRGWRKFPPHPAPLPGGERVLGATLRVATG